MTRPPLRFRDRARHAIQGWTIEDHGDDLTIVDADAVPTELRRRDLGIPDAVWFSVVMGLGAVLGTTVALATTPVLGESLAFALGLSPAFAAVLLAYRRWGHRQFRWRRVLRDGLIGLPLGLVGGLIHAAFTALLP